MSEPTIMFYQPWSLLDDGFDTTKPLRDDFIDPFIVSMVKFKSPSPDVSEPFPPAMVRAALDV